MYTINKHSPNTYDSATGEKIVERSVKARNWKQVLKIISSGDWFYGGGFSIEKGGNVIGTNETFSYCDGYSDGSMPGVREFINTHREFL